MRILLVNPNRYVIPPVPPIGLEHVAGTLDRIGHESELLDLCFSEKPERDIHVAISSFRPDIVGVTVRNVDTVLYQTNEFFLEDIRRMIHDIKERSGLSVIIGGTGVSTNPAGVLEYLGADYAVEGPAEDAVRDLLHAVAGGGIKNPIFRRR
ncbi:MAG: cobalamin B12-binding domain-containing protein [Nitrospiraceae bacterium]|nr:cobalamin B12-binding domain-containing protein [Nitrospiraceae bacterium]